MQFTFWETYKNQPSLFYQTLKINLFNFIKRWIRHASSISNDFNWSSHLQSSFSQKREIFRENSPVTIFSRIA